MKVFVTGATGLVGAHSAMALLDAGHDVRLLVRSDAGVTDWFARLGYVVDDLVVGDMRDEQLLQRTIPGCDAVLHAAAMTSVTSPHATEMFEHNTSGIDAVLGTACRLGIDRLLYVSSISVLFRPGADHLDESSPLGAAVDPYARSKRACEIAVRRMQEEGQPILISYPSAVYGPDDPKLSASNQSLQALLRIVPQTSTGIQFVDVRDVALAHRLLLEEGPPAAPEDGRFVVAGHFRSWSDFHGLLQDVTGRRIPAPTVPGAAMRALGRAVDLVRRVAPTNSQLSAEAMRYVTQWSVADSTRFLTQSGQPFRPVSDTVTDTIRWMVDAGHLEPRLAGELASG